MKFEYRLKQTSWALAVAICVSCMLAGCGKEEPAVAPSSPASYMHDPEFRNQLKAQESAKRDIMKRFSAARQQLERARAENPDSELVKDLQAKLKSLEAEHQANRRQTQALVRERITPKKNLK